MRWKGVLYLVVGLMVVDASAGGGQRNSAWRTAIEELQNKRFRVQCNIDAENGIRNSVVSYINRELRALGDVRVVENSPDCIIHINALEDKTVGGRRTGYSVARTVRKPYSLRAWRILLQNQGVDSTVVAAVENSISGYDIMLAQGVYTTGTAGLQALCERMVANFDAEILEPARKENREHIRLLEEYAKKQR